MTSEDDQELVWKCLADPTRRRILDLLRDGPRTTGEITAEFDDLTRFAVMKHIGRLREASLVIVEARGRERWHYLNAVPLKRIVQRWVHPYADEAAGSLLRLKRYIEKD
jgi:DNA-binding transcriptional ArsR family regulator